ncbi:MAG: hypothetical protein KDC02_25955, partial [Flavobacteriales bacterium]|nr:hypothetical protein [Flavobacteriales bacterium]
MKKRREVPHAEAQKAQSRRSLYIGYHFPGEAPRPCQPTSSCPSLALPHIYRQPMNALLDAVHAAG